MTKVTFLSKLTGNWTTIAMIGAIGLAAIKINSTIEGKIEKTIQTEMIKHDLKDSARLSKLEHKFRYSFFQLDTAQRNSFDRFILSNAESIEDQNRILKEINKRQKEQNYMFLFNRVENDSLLKKNFCQQRLPQENTL